MRQVADAMPLWLLHQTTTGRIRSTSIWPTARLSSTTRRIRSTAAILPTSSSGELQRLWVHSICQAHSLPFRSNRINSLNSVSNGCLTADGPVAWQKIDGLGFAEYYQPQPQPQPVYVQQQRPQGNQGGGGCCSGCLAWCVTWLRRFQIIY
ncbi:hypothetical protein BD324DRAFT_621759 [Kockovaella imperatae]|uniref:Cysteine-rich transmembrane domain-containing protein n=1 Tax=Kockovaella imperatae TaxID=4999 RepID=A0A1Y1UKR1_9TREE|nr:hypothetical protein BD324DRAFT_621759 [Kockovaella imperatae]ORX38643.1 hypothetical protein BD324DRAFT_621759 [Kockovaella imperatae]